MEEGLQARYLRILGAARKRPSEASLREIVGAHLARVPFENVSKLHRWRHEGLASPPDLDLYLKGIEESGFGGTCYANNYHLSCLLKSLEYDADLSGADMSRPNAHLVIRVRLDGREWLVDAGYAAPFREPLPMDLDTDQVVAWGSDRYVLAPKDATGRSRMTMFRNGERLHGYVVNPEPRRIGDFDEAIADSFRPASTFMNAILLARFGPQRSFVLHNLTLVETEGRGWSVRRLRDRAELCDAAHHHFGMPRKLVESVLDGLPSLLDTWTPASE